MRHLIAGVVVVSLSGTACIGQRDDAGPAEVPADGLDGERVDVESDLESVDAGGDRADDGPNAAAGGPLVRDDVDCSERGLAGDSGDEFTSAYFVVDGELGELCHGDADPTLMAAWELLIAIVPPGELRPLGLFSGFDAPDSDTLAFVDAVGQFDGRVFQMALNLPLSDPDGAELAMTLAHEFSHVLTGHRSQLDRLSDPASCDTFDNGVGCVEPGSYLDEWVGEFWDGDLLAGLDVEVDDPDDAEQRCDLDPGFLGPYAATNPDEDFAESFAAYVFDVEVAGSTLERKLAFFDTYPELAAFRDRVSRSRLDVSGYTFDRCG